MKRVIIFIWTFFVAQSIWATQLHHPSFNQEGNPLPIVGNDAGIVSKLVAPKQTAWCPQFLPLPEITEQEQTQKIQQTRYQELTKKQIRQIKRDQRQKARELENQAEYNAAIEALKNLNWVLMANTLYGPLGNAIPVSNNTNFIQFKENIVYVQLAFNGIAGPNGLGGITLQGIPSQVSFSVDKQGNVNYSFYVNGIVLTAQVVISINANSNYANATVYPMTNSNNLTFSGRLVPTSQASIFRSGFISF